MEKRSTKSTKKRGRSKAVVTVVDLTPGELKQLAKPREDFEEFVAQLIELYEDNRDGATIKGVDPDEIRTELVGYEAMNTAVPSTQLQLQKEMKTRALHASNVWRGMLRIYKWAQFTAATNDEVKRGIARFHQFLANGPRKKSATVPATP